jgi:hypothetical protein
VLRGAGDLQRAALALLTEEQDKSALFDRNLVRKTDVLALRRAEAGLDGDLGELMGRGVCRWSRLKRC